ncbi:MAG: hypothetical protein OEY01_03660 [Desulfobulbaceae bacterium]|nr:hypothetical protein [Desulfobulbaceae bacterium]
MGSKDLKYFLKTKQNEPHPQFEEHPFYWANTNWSGGFKLSVNKNFDFVTVCLKQRGRDGQRVPGLIVESKDALFEGERIWETFWRKLRHIRDLPEVLPEPIQGAKVRIDDQWYFTSDYLGWCLIKSYETGETLLRGTSDDFTESKRHLFQSVKELRAVCYKRIE